MCPRRLGRWCSRTRRAKSGASEAASFFLCLRRAAATPLVPIRKFDQYDGSQPCGGCTCCSATPGYKFSRQFSCRDESRTAELVAAADAGAHGVAKWAASGSDGSHVQSSESGGGTHAGDGGRGLPFRVAEIGSGAEIGYGGLPNQYADGEHVVRTAAGSARADDSQVSGADAGGRDLSHHAGPFREWGYVER